MENNRTNYMPAEWEQHERTLIQWPVRPSLVFPDHYNLVRQGYVEVIKAIAEFEKVTVLVNENTLEETKELCKDKAELLVVPHNDGWCRDSGPTFLWNSAKKLSAVNWKFNAWGERFAHYDLDNEVAPRVLEHFGISYINAQIVIEGGSIHVDGEGTLLTTRECLLNKNRNPQLTIVEIEEEVKRQVGVSKIIWLNHGLFGDETDGHVDNVACFAKPGVIIMQTCSDPGDPNYEITMENMEILKNSIDACGRKLELIQIPQPPARYYEDIRLTLSYLNFYLVNGGIILPVFGEDATDSDNKAEEILKQVFPDRRIVTVDGMALIKEGGNVHCITQQMPKGIR
jgi:agmatine deiminase